MVAPKPGKTGVFDKTVLIDKCPELINVLPRLLVGKRPEDPLWRTSGTDDVVIFAEAVKATGLDLISACRYGLRHGGASDDLMTGARSALEVKRRGRWLADSSLKRYAKETRILSELSKLPRPTIVYGRLVLDNIQAVLEGKRLAPPHLAARP